MTTERYSSRRRRRRAGAGGSSREMKRHLILEPIAVDIKVPSNFLCPISLELMKDPVIVSSGVTYDRSSIEKWLEAGNRTCPVTKQNILQQQQNAPYPTPNHSLRKMIQDWCVQNPSLGMERIPTPKTPLSLDTIIHLLKHGDYNAKQTAVVHLKRLLSLAPHDMEKPTVLDHGTRVKIDDLGILLLDLIKHAHDHEPSSSSSMAAAVVDSCLYVIFRLFDEKMVMKPTRNGVVLVDVLLQLLVDHAKERSMCDKALGILDMIFDSDQGLEQAYANALTIPVLVKKILRVSDAATEHSVSAIRKLLFWNKLHGMSVDLQDANKREIAVKGAAVEALQMGAFQKLLLLLQIGCSDSAKEKATQILKLLNAYRDGVECVGSGDFKDLKRTF